MSLSRHYSSIQLFTVLLYGNNQCLSPRDRTPSPQTLHTSDFNVQARAKLQNLQGEEWNTDVGKHGRESRADQHTTVIDATVCRTTRYGRATNIWSRSWLLARSLLHHFTSHLMQAAGPAAMTIPRRSDCLLA